MITRKLAWAAAMAMAAHCFEPTVSQAQVRWQMAIGAPESNYQGQIVRQFVNEVNRDTHTEHCKFNCTLEVHCCNSPK